MFYRLRGVALVLAVLTAGCGDDAPTAPTPTTPGTIAVALLSCPPSVERQSVDALPVTISWDLPTVAGIPVDKGSCSPVSGSAFPIGTSTVVCTADQTTLASSCSFSITITPPDPTLRFTRFMAFGDSITEGFIRPGVLPPAVTPREIAALLRAAVGRPIPGISNAVQPLNAYPAQLHNLLTSAYATQLISVANEGLSGERASEGVSRLTASLLAGQPEVLMLFEGFNDIDDTPNNVASIAADLRSMALNAQGRGVEVLLTTLTLVTDAREESTRHAGDDHRAQCRDPRHGRRARSRRCRRLVRRAGRCARYHRGRRIPSHRHRIPPDGGHFLRRDRVPLRHPRSSPLAHGAVTDGHFTYFFGHRCVW